MSSTNSTKRTYLIGSLFLLACICFLVIRRHNAKLELVVSENGKDYVLRTGKVRSARLYDLKNNNWTSIDDMPKAKVRLEVFLSAADCPFCLDETQYWNQVAEANSPGKLAVDVIILRSSESEARAVMNTLSIKGSALWDGGQEIDAVARIPPQTPIAVLTNSSSQVLLGIGPTNSSAVVESFIQQINEAAAAGTK